MELRPVFLCLGAILCPQAGDGMVVYADMVFVLNFLVNYTLLQGSARLGAAVPRKWLMCLGAAVGGLYSVLVFLPTLVWLRHPLCKVLTAVLMLLCAFGWKPGTLRLGAIFGTLSLVLCGAVYGIHCMRREPISAGTALLYPVSFSSLLLTAFAVVAACRLLLPPLNHSKDSILPLTLERKGKRVHLSALRDSGNTLRDPLSGGEVLTVYWKAIRPLLPPDFSEESLQNPIEVFSKLDGYCPRLIPYRSVGTKKGLLLAIPLHITIGKESRIGLVALSPTPVSDGGAYEALTGGISYV